jgi:hypothetical protein
LLRLKCGVSGHPFGFLSTFLLVHVVTAAVIGRQSAFSEFVLEKVVRITFAILDEVAEKIIIQGIIHKGIIF